MPSIEAARVATKQSAHDGGDGGVAGAQQQMKMIGDQGPGITGGLGFNQNRSQPFDEIIAVGIGPKYFPTLDSTAYDVMQGTGTAFRGMRCKYHGRTKLESYNFITVPIFPS